LQISTAKTLSLTTSLQRWRGSAHRKIPDSNASGGWLTSRADADRMEALFRPNDSMHMDKSQIPVAILVRVSTAKQETARQIIELEQFADAKGYTVVEVCQETISGSAVDDERHGLRRAEELARAGRIQKVLVHEISRIARKNSVAHRFVETLEDCGVSLYWHAQGVETLLQSGKRNPAAGIMLALLAEMARNESETLRERIKSGLALARKRGVTLGRRKGTTLSREQLLQKHKDIVRQLKIGQSVRNTAKIVAKGMSTVQRVKAALLT
jgi:DNA invertase Pin-like site-specific DNA recombinase